jgi:hypothetical protein
MNLVDRLDLIDRLVSENKTPAEIRGHIMAIREQLEAYLNESQFLTALKEKIKQLEASNERLVSENQKLVSENAALINAPVSVSGGPKGKPAPDMTTD